MQHSPGPQSMQKVFLGHTLGSMHKFGLAFGLRSYLSEFLWKPALWFESRCLFESANESSLAGEHSVRFQRSLSSVSRGSESLSLGPPRLNRRSAFGVFLSREGTLSFSLEFKLLSSGLSGKSSGERLPQLVIGAGLLDSHRKTCRALSQESY